MFAENQRLAGGPLNQEQSAHGALVVDPDFVPEDRDSYRYAPPAPSRVTAGPTAEKERVGQLDVLRGFAVLGILLMNIQSFSMVEAAYEDPLVAGGMDWLNLSVWVFNQIFSNMKFMNLFSFLYGAGIFLFASRLEAKGLNPTRLFLRRSIVLVGFGMAHSFLLWSGDILFAYALCGLAVFSIRRFSSRLLLIIAALAMMIPCVVMSLITVGSFMAQNPEEAAMMAAARVDPMLYANELRAFRGSYLEQMPLRVSRSVTMETVMFLLFTFWRSGSLMILGLVAMRSRFLRGRLPRFLYGDLALWGLLGGTILGSLTVYGLFERNFEHLYVILVSPLVAYWVSLMMTAGYVGLFFYWAAVGGGRWLAPVGRMAFSNYLGQTVMCTTLFYGHGFGLFGYLDRFEQLLVVLAIWTFQIGFSHWWMARHAFGPMEWVWRTLTYGRPPEKNVPGRCGTIRQDC